MSRPVLFVLDDDAGVVRALRGDLSRRFSQDFRVLGESSAAVGLATLSRLARHGEPVALLIVDHHMPEMPGLEFLARAHELHPAAKRVLLVERDYSVRSPVSGHDPRPGRLLPEQAVDAGAGPLPGRQRVPGRMGQGPGSRLRPVPRHRRAPDPGTNELRELLIRFNVPFRFSAADSQPGRRLLQDKGLDPARLPVMIRHDGYTMVEPTPARIVEAVGGTTHSDISQCDVAIIGAGPAASRPLSTPHPRACRRSCWRRQSPAARRAAAR